ncbi:MAG: type II secretion system protein N [Smithellaceae bacterium]|jgi:general secretion pathway protein C
MRLKIEMLLKKIAGYIRNIVANPAILLPVLPTFLIVVAITILSYETVGLFYKIISLSTVNQSTAAKNTASSKLVTDSASRSSLQNYGVITERNLFQSTLKAISDKQLGGGFFGASQEMAAFDLKGTIAGGDSFGFIVIEERGKNKQRLYHLGDMIGSARLIKITRNTAIIKSEGREIILKIKETPEGALLSRLQTPPASIPSSGMVLSKGEVNEKLRDLKTIMTQAIVRPYFEDGVQEGFIVSDIKPNSLYQKLGLHNGDIIIDVNGKPVQTADDILQMVNIMQTGGSLDVSLKRNGEFETINYSFY